MGGALSGAVGGLLALALVTALGWTGLLAVGRFAPKVRTSTRWIGAVIIVYWLLSALFWALIGAGAFTVIAAMASAALIVLLAHRSWGEVGTAAFVSDVGHVAQLLKLRRRHAPLIVAGSAVAIVTGARLLRGLAAPPMATDSLTYHLLRAGRWVAWGAWPGEQAPDAAGYYEYYPPLGDALWAWTMLPVSGDSFVAAAGVACLLTLTLATYATAAALGAPRMRASLAALLLVSTPCVLVFVTTAYVDIPALAMFTAGTVWLAVAMSARDSSELTFASTLGIGALSVSAGIKLPGAVPLALAVGLVCVKALANRSRTHIWSLVCGLLVAMGVIVPWLVRGALDHGNPIYPFPLSIAGYQVFAGNEENTLNMAAAMVSEERATFDPVGFVETLFVPNPSPGVQHLNFAFGGPVIAGLGLVGWWTLLRRPGSRVIALFFGLVSLAVIASLMSKSMLAHRSFAAPAVGRLLTMVLASAAVSTAFVRGRAMAWITVGLVAVGSWYAWPQGFGRAARDAVVELCFSAVPIVFGASLVIWALRRHGRIAASVGLGSGLAVAAAVHVTRPHHRYPIYASAVSAQSFDPHPTDPRPSGAWPIWQALDTEQGVRIAFAAGWDGRGHHWYRYPLLGSRLQNDVVYIPPTDDGSIIDYREHQKLAAASNMEAWLRRLHAADIEVLVLGSPAPPESQWVAALPAVFEPLAWGLNSRNVAFAIRRPALDQLFGRRPVR